MFSKLFEGTVQSNNRLSIKVCSNAIQILLRKNREILIRYSLLCHI